MFVFRGDWRYWRDVSIMQGGLEATILTSIPIGVPGTMCPIQIQILLIATTCPCRMALHGKTNPDKHALMLVVCQTFHGIQIFLSCAMESVGPALFSNRLTACLPIKRVVLVALSPIQILHAVPVVVGTTRQQVGQQPQPASTSRRRIGKATAAIKQQHKLPRSTT